MTNGEKIRQMDDEELAEELCDKIIEDCSICPGYAYCFVGGGHGNGLEKWLKEEVEE